MSFELTLNQIELEKAIKNHIATLGLVVVNKEITVEFGSTRKPAGYNAVVIISDMGEEIQPRILNDEEKQPEAFAAESPKTVVQQRVVKAKGPEPVVEEAEEELPLPTPETTGHESKPTSLFGD